MTITITTAQAALVEDRPPIDPARRTGRRGGTATAAHERQLQAWEARRLVVLTLAGKDARARIGQFGRMAAVRDALAALADPAAESWAQQRARLIEAAGSGDQSVFFAARAGARKAAGDAVRGGRNAPDAEIASAATTAFAVLQLAPRCVTALQHPNRRRRARRR